MTGFSFLAVLAIKSSLIWGIAWLAAGLLRRRSAAARHLVWTCAAAAIVALPLFTALLPALEVAPAVADPGLWFQAEATAGGGPGALAAGRSVYCWPGRRCGGCGGTRNRSRQQGGSRCWRRARAACRWRTEFCDRWSCKF